MDLFATPTLPDVCLLGVTVILILLIRTDNTLKTYRKILSSGLVCISMGVLSLIAKLDPRLCSAVMIMVGIFCIRLGWKLLRQARHSPGAYYRIIE